MKKNLVLAVMLWLGLFTGLVRAQQAVYLVDAFDPAGVGGNSYLGGHIGSVWANWFGSAFQSLSWDSASDASNNSGFRLDENHSKFQFNEQSV